MRGTPRFRLSLAPFVFAMSLICAAQAGACVHYEDHLTWIGGVTTPGNGVDVAVVGSMAYVADGLYGLSVVDLTDPVIRCCCAASRATAWRSVSR